MPTQQLLTTLLKQYETAEKNSAPIEKLMTFVRELTPPPNRELTSNEFESLVKIANPEVKLAKPEYDCLQTVNNMLLHDSVKKADSKRVALMMTKNIDINSQESINQDTVLHAYVNLSRNPGLTEKILEIADLLLKHPDISLAKRESKLGNMPLHLAVLFNDQLAKKYIARACETKDKELALGSPDTTKSCINTH